MGEAKRPGLSELPTVSGTIESLVATSNSPADIVVALRNVQVFSDLPEDQLKWFAENVEDRRFAPGEVLFRKGDPPDWMAIVLEGEIHAYENDKFHHSIFIVKAGDPRTEVSGMLPFSRMTAFTVTGRAATEIRMLRFPVRLFPELMQRMPLLVQRLVNIMSDRVREMTTVD